MRLMKAATVLSLLPLTRYKNCCWTAPFSAGGRADFQFFLGGLCQQHQKSFANFFASTEASSGENIARMWSPRAVKFLVVTSLTHFAPSKLGNRMVSGMIEGLPSQKPWRNHTSPAFCLLPLSWSHVKRVWGVNHHGHRQICYLQWTSRGTPCPQYAEIPSFVSSSPRLQVCILYWFHWPICALATKCYVVLHLEKWRWTDHKVITRPISLERQRVSTHVVQGNYMFLQEAPQHIKDWLRCALPWLIDWEASDVAS